MTGTADEGSGAAVEEIRRCVERETENILNVINTAAIAYRGVIPADRWHEPYMAMEDLRIEIARGVRFAGFFSTGNLIGVMGAEPVKNAWLIRHAYVLPKWQGNGVGAKLIAYLCPTDGRQFLIGTWQAATWAIRFYERHGFGIVSDEASVALLRCFWQVPDRQIATSVVLATPMLSTSDADRLIADSCHRAMR